MVGEGSQEYQKLLDGGFSQPEANQWRAERTAKLQAGGFTQKEIGDYWGEGDRPSPVLNNIIQQNISDHWSPDKVRQADPNSWVDLLSAGWNMSSTSLVQHAPKVVAPEHMGMLQNIVYGIGQFAGDVPAGIAGFIGGAAAGGGAGAAASAPTAGAAAPVTAPLGALAGGGFGSAALPEAIRQVAMDGYQNGEFLSFNDFMRRASTMTWNTAKAGVVGLVSAPVGGMAGGKVLAATGSRVLGGAAEVTGFATSATLVGAGLEGQVPDQSSFVEALVLMGTFHAGGALVRTVGATKRPVPTADGERVMKNMQDIYARTGVPPWEQAKRAQQDPKFQQDIYSRDANEEPIYSGFKEDAPPEPEPYKQITGPSEDSGFRKSAGGVRAEHEAEVSSIEADAAKRAAELSPQDQLNLIRQLERSGDDAVSPAGAVGRYQIMPNTAIQYGFDPAKLKDPAYNERVAKTILSDLSSRYRNADGTVDTEAVLIAYNAGPGRAQVYRANGRNFNKLPTETQRYLERAERMGAVGGGRGGKGGGREPPKEPPTGERPEPSDMKPEDLVREVNDSIADPITSSMFDKTKDAIDRFTFEAVSELSPAERLDAKLGIPKDEIGVSDVFRQVYGSTGRAFHMLRYGALEFGFNEKGQPEYRKASDIALLPAYEDAIKAGSLDEFKAVRQAARTLELTNRGMKTSVDPVVAEATLRTLGPKYKVMMDKAQAANDAKIDFYQQSGMLSKEGAAAIKANNKYWFPQITEENGVGYATSGSRFGPRQAVKTAKGHQGKILDPATQEIKSFYTMAALADKNRAVRILAEALTPEEMDAIGMRRLPSPKGKEISVVDENGNVNMDVADNTGPAKLKDNQFSYYKDGVRHVMETDDPQLAAMVKGISPIKPDQVVDAFRWFAKIKRSGITDMPDFIGRAMAKDTVAAAILSKWGGVPFVNTIRGLMHLSRADKMFQEFTANGGFGASLTDMDANYVIRDLHKVQADAGLFQGVVNTVSHPLEAAQLLMQRMDSATRLGVFIRAKEAGLAPVKAGIEARRATLDFQERAASQTVNLLAGMTPFFRPSVLGLKQIYTAFAERPVETGLKSMVYIAAPAAALYALNYLQDETLPDDQKFANLPRWQKDTMFILPSINGVRVRIPMPPILGTMVGGMVNRTLDYFVQNDPRAFKDWANTLLANLIPPMVPAAALPIYEHIANYNSFRGTPLIPGSMEAASKYMQWLPNTSETAKAVARFLGPANLNLVDVSPIVLDNYVREWTGAMGSGLLRVLEAPYAPDTRPTESWFTDNPFIGSLFVQTPGTSAQPIMDFYDALDKVRTAHKDLKLAIERQDESLSNFNAEQVQAFLKLTAFENALRAQRSAINAITTDDKMTIDEKRQDIHTIYSGMIQVSKGGLVLTDAVDKGAAQ